MLSELNELTDWFVLNRPIQNALCDGEAYSKKNRY